MLDGLLTLPTAPPGVDRDQHLRNVISTLCSDVDEHLDRLHRIEDDAQRDEAADVSTTLRELRQIAQEAIGDDTTNEDELHTLLGALTSFVDRSEHLFIAADLRVALAEHPAHFDVVERHALAIGDFCGGAFMQYVTNDVRDVDRFHRIERAARVPLMHAFMRAIAAGMADASEQVLRVEDMEAEVDNLIDGVIDRFPPVRADMPLRHLRVASLASTTLWNVVRRARKAASPEAQAASIALRGRSMEPLRADVRYQAQRLDSMPDLDFWYDVGLGHGMFMPVLERVAEQQELVVPARPDVFAWWSMLGSALRER